MPSGGAYVGPPLVLALEGPSGVGKTSTARELARLLEGTAVPEAYERLDGSVPLTYGSRSELSEIELALLDEDARRWREAGQLRAQGTPVVLDTGTLGTLTYSWGIRESLEPAWDVTAEVVRRARQLRAEHHWGLPDLTLYLDAPETVAASRAARGAKDHPPELRERHRTVGRFERLLYGREFPRRLPGRFGSVSAEASPAAVALGIRDRLERLGPLPPARAVEVDHLLVVFEGSGPGGARPPEPPRS